MRIISKFKDYYDGASSMGIDQTLIYERSTKYFAITELLNFKEFIVAKRKHLELESIHFNPNNYRKPENYVDIISLQIGFCGRIYSGVIFEYFKEKEFSNYEVFYSPQEFHKSLDNILVQNKNAHLHGSFWGHFNKAKLKMIDEYFKNNDINLKNLQWFQKINSPIFIHIDKLKSSSLDSINDKEVGIDLKKVIIVNSSLNDLKFFKVKDSFTAFQEISQFFGGVLTNVEVSNNNLNDKEKIQQHGFDDKYGFRKRPKNKINNSLV